MIDKDIELVSNLKNVELKGKVNEQYIYAKIPEEYLNAIENVLVDRETWKKIAEKLAEEVFLHISFAKPTEENIKILIENARKEVEKDVKD